MSSTRRQILDNIEDTLKTITPGSTYHNSIGYNNVGRKVVLFDECDAYPYICIFGGKEDKEHGEETLMHAFMEVTLYLFVKDPDNANQALEDLIEDVETVMYVDHSRGGLAVDTKMLKLTTTNFWLQPHGVAELTFEIHYRYYYGSP